MGFVISLHILPLTKQYYSYKRINHKKKKNDILTNKNLEILELLRQQAVKLEKIKVALELDIELKKALLENARMYLEFSGRYLILTLLGRPWRFFVICSLTN